MRFVPNECVTIQSTLAEILVERFGDDQPKIRKNWWDISVNADDPILGGIPRNLVKPMRESILILQQGLCDGAWEACYIGREGIVKIKPAVFLREHMTSWLAHGFVSPSETGEKKKKRLFLLSRTGKRIDEIDGGQNNQNPGGGRPNKAIAAAEAYWSEFPESHVGKESTYWAQALYQVNTSLEAAGREPVGMTTLENAIKSDPRWAKNKTGP